MTLRSICIFGFALAAMATAIGAAPRRAPSGAIAGPDANTTALTWTQDAVSYTGGDWDGAVRAAAAWTEGGFTDWRLPTPAELQAAVQGGTWGQASSSGSHRGWTNRTSGVWAYAVKIVTDANGNPIPSQSGQLTKHLKGSNFAGTKFVRP